MKALFYQQQVLSLLDMVEQQRGEEASNCDVLPVSDYLDAGRLQQEQQLFKQLPTIDCAQL